MLTIAILLISALGDTATPAPISATTAEKQAFFALLETLPREGEFYTDEGVATAAPHLRVLLCLTEDDIARYAKSQGIEDYCLYPFLALARGLCDLPPSRAYVVAHFRDIAHPQIQGAWAAMLFNEHDVSDEIVRYLRAVLETKDHQKILPQMRDKDFAEFKQRVKDYRLKDGG